MGGVLPSGGGPGRLTLWMSRGVPLPPLEEGTVDGTAEGWRLNGEDVARAAWRASDVGATSGETAILTVVPSGGVGVGIVLEQ